MLLEMFTCPNCERPVWLPPDAPSGTPCPHCDQPLGTVSCFPNWDLQNATTIDLTALVPDVAALERVSEGTVREFGVFPVEIEGEGKLGLAVPPGIDLEELNMLYGMLYCPIRPVLAEKLEIEAAIDLWYR